MNILNKITSAAYQQFFLTGNPGQTITLTLRFLPTQNLWTMDLAYNDFSVNSVAVVAGVNLLRNYRNIIPFGICCITLNGLDPYYIDDFSNLNAALYLLSAEEVINLEAEYFE